MKMSGSPYTADTDTLKLGVPGGTSKKYRFDVCAATEPDCTQQSAPGSTSEQ
jgi:hypothetical protein